MDFVADQLGDGGKWMTSGGKGLHLGRRWLRIRPGGRAGAVRRLDANGLGHHAVPCAFCRCS